MPELPRSLISVRRLAQLREAESADVDVRAGEDGRLGPPAARGGERSEPRLTA
jgi:hypothetical protein